MAAVPKNKGLTIHIRPAGAWLAVTVEERPEAQTQGRTLAEVLENVADACHELDLARKSLKAGKNRA